MLVRSRELPHQYCTYQWEKIDAGDGRASMMWVSGQYERPDQLPRCGNDSGGDAK
jgi:hypothetical protein